MRAGTKQESHPHTCGWRCRDANRHSEVAEAWGADPFPRRLLSLGDSHIHTAAASAAGGGAVEATIPAFKSIAAAAASAPLVVVPVSVLSVVASNADAAADTTHAAAALGAVAIR